MTKASPAAVAYMEQLLAYYHDPGQAPHQHPPAPPSHEVACELAASASRVVAIILDRLKTGEMHVDNPCPEAVLAAGELAEKAFDGTMRYEDAVEVARRFGWKGDADPT